MALSAPADLPLVAIVGKPNVGKSTLFNRLVGSRMAITDPTPGVTRDPIEFEADLGERRIRLVDTGGVTGSREALDVAVSRRSMEYARRADLVLLVVDVTEQTGEDERFVAELRPLADRIIVVANKADTDEREQMAWELHRLGFPRVIAVSAENGSNVEELGRLIIEALLTTPPATEAEDRREPDMRIAILGKPNTGKSTLLNRLLGEERSLVSDVPGTTRDVVAGTFFHGGKLIQALDTAGIRRKSSVSSSVEFYSVNRTLRSIESADVVLLLIDSLDSVSDQDKKIASVVVRRGRGIILCLNKWDTVKKVPNILTAMRDRVDFLFPVLHFAPVLPLSAKTGFGVDRVLDTAFAVLAQMAIRVPAAPLNRALASWTEQHDVPSRGKNIRIRFMAQTALRPTTFVCYVNKTRSFPKSYFHYLENKIRQEFGLGMVPLCIELEESHS